MRAFDYSALPGNLMSPDVTNMVSAIHEFKGRQDLYLATRPDVLDRLCEEARIQSTGASNRIEGIRTTDGRLAKLVSQRIEPRNRDEAEIAGYRDVLATIHENYEHIGVKPGVILRLHRDLYRHTALSYGGRWKDSDNAIVEFDATGGIHLRFKPLSAMETPDAVEGLCTAYREAISTQRYDPLLLACMFTFDFVCIHPFNDGNGRMSRLIMLLLLYRSGYLVGRYVSIERIIEQTKQTYYEALRESSVGWQEGTCDYGPIVRYLLGTVLGAYRDFEGRAAGLMAGGKSKAQRVAAVFGGRLGKVTKSDILAECPDISQTTVERALKELLDAGTIEKVGRGRSTGYVAR
jgi:Fic family protein